MVAERLRIEAELQDERQRMEQMFQRMQGLGERVGAPIPPALFPTPPPTAVTPVSINFKFYFIYFLMEEHLMPLH